MLCCTGHHVCPQPSVLSVVSISNVNVPPGYHVKLSRISSLGLPHLYSHPTFPLSCNVLQFYPCDDMLKNMDLLKNNKNKLILWWIFNESNSEVKLWVFYFIWEWNSVLWAVWSLAWDKHIWMKSCNKLAPPSASDPAVCGWTGRRSNNLRDGTALMTSCLEM